MSAALSEAKSELIKTIAAREGISDFTIEVQAGSIKGDNYLGIINTVHLQDKNEPNRELNLILKSAQENKNLREKAPVVQVYDREIYMYETVFPEFARFQEEKGVAHPFREIAKCYGTISSVNEECLVFENLKKLGFKLWNRMVPMNADHVEIVFRTYGKFHAVSLALKNHNREKFDEYDKVMFNIFGRSGQDRDAAAERTQVLFENGFKAVAGNEQATAALTNFSKGLPAYFEELQDKDEYAVVNHGDCWCNNMLFKYEDPENPAKPTDMRLLDWQLSKIGSPVMDLSYFFLTCSSEEVLYDYKHFLKIYHEALSGTLREAGCDPDKFFPFAELENQWRKHVKFGLFLALMIIRIMLSESDEALDLGEMADAGKDLLEMVTGAAGSNEEVYLKRIRDVVNFMVDQNFI